MLTLVKDCQGDVFAVVANLEHDKVKELCDRMTTAVVEWWCQKPEPPNTDGQAFFVADKLGVLLPRQGGGLGSSDDLETVFRFLIRQNGGTVADFGFATAEI